MGMDCDISQQAYLRIVDLMPKPAGRRSTRSMVYSELRPGDDLPTRAIVKNPWNTDVPISWCASQARSQALTIPTVRIIDLLLTDQ